MSSCMLTARHGVPRPTFGAQLPVKQNSLALQSESWMLWNSSKSHLRSWHVWAHSFAVHESLSNPVSRCWAC